MNSCPNIGGKEITKRRNFIYIGVFITILTFFFIVNFDLKEFVFLIFFPAFATGVVLFETMDNTCIVYSFLGIKNMGSKYEKERNEFFLKSQRIGSIIIILKGLLTGFVFTFLFYFVFHYFI